MITARLNPREVTNRLNAMQAKVRAATYRRVLKKAGAPVATKLQRAWSGARRRGGLVTGEIADAQEMKIKVASRGKNAGRATLEIGANYRRGGYAKLWHILENGFRHYSKGSSTYMTLGSEVNLLKRRKAEFRKSALESIGGMPKDKAGRNAARMAVRAAWQKQAPEADQIIGSAQKAREGRREQARAGGSRVIPGRRISRPIAQQHVDDVAVKAQELLVAEVMSAARGRG